MPEPAFIEPVYAGGIRSNRGISIPPNLRPGPEQRLSVGYTASNSYLNPGFLVCADRSCQLEYESDHTGNLIFADFRQPLLQSFELGVHIGTYSMNNIPALSPLHRLASDDALRSFHDDVLREDSLPVLSNAPDGRQRFSMTDLDGRRLALKPEHQYILPVRIDLTRYFEIRRRNDARMDFNAGVHISYPFEGDPDPGAGFAAFSRGMDFGISANFTHSRRITPNMTSTYHLQVARFRSDVHVVNGNSALQGDDLERSSYALTYGLRFNGTFAGRAPCSLGIMQLSTSAQFDKARYWTWDPLIFEGGNNLRGAILGANDYGVLSYGCEFRGRQYQLSLVEDISGFSQVFTDDGAGTSYDPDFAVGIAVSWSPGARRNRG